MLISILQEGHYEIVELLLKAPGVDVNVKTKSGWTPLHLAVMVSYEHYLTYLV